MRLFEYAGPSDLPKGIHDGLTPKGRRIFVQAFNKAYRLRGDHESAVKAGHAAVEKAGERRKLPNEESTFSAIVNTLLENKEGYWIDKYGKKLPVSSSHVDDVIDNPPFFGAEKEVEAYRANPTIPNRDAILPKAMAFTSFARVGGGPSNYVDYIGKLSRKQRDTIVDHLYIDLARYRSASRVIITPVGRAHSASELDELLSRTSHGWK